MMALSEEDKTKICRILSITPSVLHYQIVGLGAALTAQIQSDIENEIGRWGSAGIKFSSFKATESNAGFQKSPEDEKKDIRRNIAVLLERPEWGNSASRAILLRG